MVIVLRPLLADGNGVRGIVGIFFQVFLGQPTLHARATFVGFDQPDRDVQCLAQGMGEKITYGREFTHRIRSADTPFTRSILQRLRRHRAGNLYASDARMVPCIDNRLVVAFDRAHPETFHRHLHVRLSRADPHLAGEDIADGQGFPIVKGDAERFVGGLGRVNLDQPTATPVGPGGNGLAAPRGCHFHVPARLGPPPETDIRLLLEHHVVTDDVRQPDPGLNADRAGANE